VSADKEKLKEKLKELSSAIGTGGSYYQYEINF
jgi:hypothetical protein